MMNDFNSSDSEKKTNKYLGRLKSRSEKIIETKAKVLEYNDKLGKRTFQEGIDEWRLTQTELNIALENIFPNPLPITKERITYLKECSDDAVYNIIYKAKEFQSTPLSLPMPLNQPRGKIKLLAEQNALIEKASDSLTQSCESLKVLQALIADPNIATIFCHLGGADLERYTFTELLDRSINDTQKLLEHIMAANNNRETYKRGESNSQIEDWLAIEILKLCQRDDFPGRQDIDYFAEKLITAACRVLGDKEKKDSSSLLEKAKSTQ